VTVLRANGGIASTILARGEATPSGQPEQGRPPCVLPGATPRAETVFTSLVRGVTATRSAGRDAPPRARNPLRAGIASEPQPALGRANGYLSRPDAPARSTHPRHAKESNVSNPPTATPDRTRQQRLDALKHANTIRSLRARWKRDIKAGRPTTPARSMILNPPSWAESMKVYDLLLALPKVGRVRANRWLLNARTAPSKTLGGLSLRQRKELVALLPDTAAQRRDRLRSKAAA
jgi:hypothetical protein